MAISMKGLRIKPKYEELIGVAVSDGLENIRFPNRGATFLRNGFVLFKSIRWGGSKTNGKTTRNDK